MRTYHHLSLEEREKLFAWKESGESLRDIAKQLGRSHSSLSHELKRHTKYGKPYLPCLADKRAKKWADLQRYKAPLKCPLVFLYVRVYLFAEIKNSRNETLAVFNPSPETENEKAWKESKGCEATHSLTNRSKTRGSK